MDFSRRLYRWASEGVDMYECSTTWRTCRLPFEDMPYHLRGMYISTYSLASFCILYGCDAPEKRADSLGLARAQCVLYFWAVRLSKCEILGFISGHMYSQFTQQWRPDEKRPTRGSFPQSSPAQRHLVSVRM